MGRPTVTGLLERENTEGTTAVVTRMLYAAGMEIDHDDMPAADDRAFYSTYVNVPIRSTAV